MYILILEFFSKWKTEEGGGRERKHRFATSIQESTENLLSPRRAINVFPAST